MQLDKTRKPLFSINPAPQKPRIKYSCYATLYWALLTHCPGSIEFTGLALVPLKMHACEGLHLRDDTDTQAHTSGENVRSLPVILLWGCDPSAAIWAIEQYCTRGLLLTGAPHWQAPVLSQEGPTL